jgi:hypothetical protein
MRTVALLGAVVGALAVAPIAAASAPVVHVTVAPRSVGLGDPFRYTVEARAPAAGTLEVVADAGPFLVVAGPTITRLRSGDVAIVRVEQTLLCVDRGCAPGARAARVALPPARATSGDVSTSAPAAAVTVVPRVPASAVAASRVRYRRQVAVPPPSTRISPGLLAGLLLAAAVVLPACALLITIRELHRVRAHAVAARVTGGIERALRFLRESAARSVPDRRRAADYAARAALARGGAGAADDATRLAWAPPDPEPTDVAALADRLETALGERA